MPGREPIGIAARELSRGSDGRCDRVRPQRTSIGRGLGWIVVQYRRHRLRGCVTLEGAHSGEHFVEHSPEAEDVGTTVNCGPANLLGRHVAGCTDYSADPGGRSAGRHSSLVTSTVYVLGESKVEDFYPSLARDEDVVRLQVAVRNVLAVRGRQTAGDLNGVVDRPTMRERASRKNSVQTFAFQ